MDIINLIMSLCAVEPPTAAAGDMMMFILCLCPTLKSVWLKTKLAVGAGCLYVVMRWRAQEILLNALATGKGCGARLYSAQQREVEEPAMHNAAETAGAAVLLIIIAEIPPLCLYKIVCQQSILTGLRHQQPI